MFDVSFSIKAPPSNGASLSQASGLAVTEIERCFAGGRFKNGARVGPSFFVWIYGYYTIIVKSIQFCVITRTSSGAFGHFMSSSSFAK